MSSESDASDYYSDGSDDFVPSPPTKKKIASKTSKSPLSDSTNNTSGSSTPSTQVGTGPKSNASETYQKLSQLEHILKRPDTYIGSVEKTKMEMWCFDAESESMKFKEVTIVPGLYKIFDEILVNAADNKIRDPTMKNIRVKIDPENNVIQVMNDGKGIPVEIHTKENMYIPELIFGNLLTSSNYNDDEKKVTGGRNGYGAKLCNIFSTEFELETADLNTGKLYKQTWTNNMGKVSKPKITTLKTKKEYTKISFKPDLAKFDMDSLDEDILAVLRRRVYDLCGTVKNCNIYLNDKRLSISNFKSYIEMYVNAIKERSPEPEGEESKNYTTIVHEVFNDRWEIAFAVSDGSFNQVSFVNSIATTSGGTHVKYVSDQIITKLVEVLSKREKGKKKLMIRPQEVRDNMFIFLNCLIENPAFTSQTKEQLTTKPSQFGGKDKFVPSDNLINRILKTGIADKIRSIARANEDKALQKADGSRKNRIKGQVNLVDANKAGTKDGLKCTLILTEGLSAMNLAVAGLSVVGRDYYGCFPLRGKLLNVREASADQIAKNAEINALKQIIGLQHKKVYTQESIKSLRYGHIMIMTDQDQDGSHIKGLIINFLETSFPGLLDIPGFLLEFITPIVKVTVKGRTKRVISFYNMPEFERWRDTEGTQCRWTQKYYKGLGTSTPIEAREYFSALDKHLKRFHALQGDDKECIDLAFSKKKADDRKEWLQGFLPGTHLDPDLNDIPISDFINKELILFSMSDNVRSIPSVLDGLKPGQRKVLFGCYKRKLRSEIKVAQLAGYVSENTGYHHGEQSLIQTIIGLAQNFIGSNNINILKPNGSFGSRAAGGKDYSAARYIFTEINEITRTIFNPLDDPLYTYVQDDEQTVEPTWYLPVLPMILVNGAEGIGTGWSTNIPSYNPKDIVANIRRLMNGEPLQEMTPWYKGWEGDIEPMGPQKYKVSGRIEQVDNNTVEITEIPVKTWTNNVKEFLLAGFGNEKTQAWIKDMEEHHTTSIRFVVKLSDAEMEKSLKVGLLERFKLVSSLSLGNMVAFDPMGRIKKYNDVLEILKDYYYVRLEFYQKRKDYMSEDLQNQLMMLSEQARFIKMIIEKKLSVANKKKKELVSLLQQHKFIKFSRQGKPIKEELFLNDDDSIEEEEEIVEASDGDISALNLKQVETDKNSTEHVPETVYSSYEYLLGMTIWSLTYERYLKLLKQRDIKEAELNELLSKSAKDLWNEDLERFMVEFDKFLIRDQEERESLAASGDKNKKKRTRKAPAKEPPKKKIKSEPIVKSEPVVTPASPKPIEKKSDVLSFFSPTSSSSSSKSKAGSSKKKPVTLFSDSEDDELIFGSSNNSTPKKSIKKSPSSEPKKTKKKTSIKDELDDLKIEGKLMDTISSSGSRRPARERKTTAKRALTPAYVIDSDEDEDDDIEVLDDEDDEEYGDD
ncbi:DNA topoisomerase 2 [Spathaspora passalidarum NRRL Y-27907]|uniref:DNA topoisomerase 2 n=1 Tax=Spathaspora passalidarum (strain NRRL Y-27907 / 11-Y1) TaxID=619300 RepID=G3AEF9_SPAPN|nr:DNA topoisomerase 2 [Spathaspora passalidarum NRRL Y-27907]EGW35747.1 DNA topoisomerase 2 [Spathaspora passalidarum NRRL Y-27907]